MPILAVFSSADASVVVGILVLIGTYLTYRRSTSEHTAVSTQLRDHTAQDALNFAAIHGHQELIVSLLRGEPVDWPHAEDNPPT